MVEGMAAEEEKVGAAMVEAVATAARTAAVMAAVRMAAGTSR